jgi:hypothetical protein
VAAGGGGGLIVCKINGYTNQTGANAYDSGNLFWKACCFSSLFGLDTDGLEWSGFFFFFIL